MSDSEKLFWKKYYGVYDDLNNLYPYRILLKEIIDEVKSIKKKNLKILDVGGGSGNLASLLIHQGHDVTVFDNSKYALEIFRNNNTNANTIMGDLNERLPINDSYYDLVICNNTLYTIMKSRHNSILTEFYRVLKKNGVLIISNPMEGAKPIRIFIDHIKIGIKDVGLLETIKELIIKTKSIFLIFKYNKKIIKKTQKNYHFFEDGEQKKILLLNGFNITNTKKVYSKQNELIIAYKL